MRGFACPVCVLTVVLIVKSRSGIFHIGLHEIGCRCIYRYPIFPTATVLASSTVFYTSFPQHTSHNWKFPISRTHFLHGVFPSDNIYHIPRLHLSPLFQSDFTVGIYSGCISFYAWKQIFIVVYRIYVANLF